jgi:hypothetical protein
MEPLGRALERCNWRRRIRQSSVERLEHAAKYLFEHSVHYINDEWPCDLDVHYNFPGFLEADATVFEALWQRRVTVEIAHVPVTCADFLGQAAIVGLHALRDPGVPHTEADLEFLVRTLRGSTPSTLEELSVLAAATGCSHTLLPLLEAVGATPHTSTPGDPELLRRWTARTQNAGIFTTYWIIELRHTPWRRRPALIWRALLLPREELLSLHLGADPGWRSVLGLQVRRWRRAARYLPRGIQAAIRSDRRSE